MSRLPSPKCYSGNIGQKKFSVQKARPTGCAFSFGARVCQLPAGGFFPQGAADGSMDEFKVFKTYKERGEWAELRMHGRSHVSRLQSLQALGRLLRLRRRHRIRPPHPPRQVKSTSNRTRHRIPLPIQAQLPQETGLPPLQQIDFFAAYVIPQDRWYIIPAKVILGARRKHAIMFCPMQPLKKNRYSHELYREARPPNAPPPEKSSARGSSSPEGTKCKSPAGRCREKVGIGSLCPHCHSDRVGATATASGRPAVSLDRLSLFPLSPQQPGQLPEKFRRRSDHAPPSAAPLPS